MLINSGNTPAAILEADIVMTAGFPTSTRSDGFYSSVKGPMVLQPGEMKSVNFSIPKDFTKAGITRVSVDGGKEQELRILTIKVEAVDINGDHHFKYCYLGKIFWDDNKVIDQVKGLVYETKWDSERKGSFNEIFDEIKYLID